MGVKSALAAVLRGRRNDAPVAPPEDTIEVVVADPANVQVFAHGLIADLFGAGLRLQSLASRVPDEAQAELEQITDQIDASVAPPMLMTSRPGRSARARSGSETGIQSPLNHASRSDGGRATPLPAV